MWSKGVYTCGVRGCTHVECTHVEYKNIHLRVNRKQDSLIPCCDKRKECGLH